MSFFPNTFFKRTEALKSKVSLGLFNEEPDTQIVESNNENFRSVHF
jgi:hypothetical protein